MELPARLVALAQTPVLLVATDYDGTISPLVIDPAAAAPDAACIEAIRGLAALAHTHAAVVSGRGRSDVARLSGLDAGVLMVGSHGAELPGVESPSPSPGALDGLAAVLGPIAEAGGAGLRLEIKPLAVALHWRGATEEAGRAAVEAALTRVGQWEGVHVRHGSKVVEFCLTNADKGSAVSKLKARTGATAILFLGDDQTDEEVFVRLGPEDVAISVGTRPSSAAYRIGGVSDVAEVLRSVLVERRKWLDSRGLVPLNEFSILSDQRAAAVISPRGRIVWLCSPRIDSWAVLADLVGGETAGYWDIRPDHGGAPRSQHYDGDSMILVTEWDGLRVTDYMDCSAGRAYQRSGRTDVIRVIEGRGEAVIRFAPRLDYGRISTLLHVGEHGISVEGMPDPLSLYAPGLVWEVEGEGPHQTAQARVRLDDGPIVLELRLGSAGLRANQRPEPERRRENHAFWSGWAAKLTLPSLHPDTVKRSALILKALCHGPSGAIAAAATTSLPEHLGGVRNWDYRFCWPRDASIAAAALCRLGNTGHALKLLDWIMGVVDECESSDRIRPIYTVTGRYLPPEAELGYLAGYGGSKPVRVSNAAALQVQLDVFGPIVDLVALLAETGAPVSPEHWRLVKAMVGAVESRWREPDHGIWELRTERRHHTHSKVMCWHTIRRALSVEECVHGRRDEGWAALAREIEAEVLAEAWSEQLGAFRGTYGHEWLDAATLWTGLSGLVPPDDPKFVATVDVINRKLRSGPVVYRYDCDDGLPGAEGGMLICAGWLAESLELVGRGDEARELLDSLVGLLGPTGTAAEQYCPKARISLGNIAQAYSHAAVIDACVALSGRPRLPAAERRGDVSS